MRGILEHEYGVPHKSIEWFAELDEDIEFTPPPDLKLTRLPHDKSVEDMLAEGELDAVIHSSIIKPIVDKDPRVGRLWPDFKSEEMRLLQEDRHLPDHARDGHQAGDRRPPSLGADQHVPGLPEGQGDRHAADGQSAHRAARLVPRGLGGAGGDARARPVGIRADRQEPAYAWRPWPAILTSRA